MEQEAITAAAPSAVPEKSDKFRGYRDELYPPSNLTVCKGNLKGFFRFMASRHRVWRNRFVKKLPRAQWAEHDKLLQTYKYTNVYRQLDRGTLWCLEFIVKPYQKSVKDVKANDEKGGAVKFSAMKNLILQLAMYRLCNRIETFEKIGLPTFDTFNPVRMLKRLYSVSEIHSPMTSAHITLSGSKGFRKMDTLTICMIDCWYQLDNVVNAINNAKTGEEVFDAIRLIRCCGGFIAYEIYCDLCYAKAIKFTTNDFVNVGPGCCEGIRLIFPSTRGNKSVKQKVYELRDMAAEKFIEYGRKFRYYNKYEPVDNQLSLRTIEHSLCEYSKYWLQGKNVGKRRMIYDNPTVSNHPTCSIGADGDSLNIDAEYYGGHFYKKSQDWGESTMWKEFIRSHPVNTDKPKPNYDALLKFVGHIVEINGLR